MKHRLTATVCVALLFVPFLAGAQQPPAPGGDPVGDTQAAVRLLERELARDNKIVEQVMNRANLKKTRGMMGPAALKKQKLINRLKRWNISALEHAIELMEETMETEKLIAEGVGATPRSKRQAYYAIKENIPKKEKAMHIFQAWLDGKR